MLENIDEKELAARVKDEIIWKGLYKPGDYDAMWRNLQRLAENLGVSSAQVCIASWEYWRKGKGIALTVRKHNGRLRLDPALMDFQSEGCSEKDMLLVLARILIRAKTVVVPKPGFWA